MTDVALSRRQQYTVHMLQETYIDLVKELGAGNVSVAELCRSADVNRTTFYRYYTDIEDMSDQMVSGMFEQIFSILDQQPTGASQSARKQIVHALNATLKNRKLCRYLLSDSHTDLAEKALEDHLTLIKATILSTGCSESEAELCYSFFCGGMARLWVNWITSDFAVPKERVALYIEQFILHFYAMLESGFML